MEEDTKGEEGTTLEDEYLKTVGEEVQAMLDPFGKCMESESLLICQSLLVFPCGM